MVAVAKVALYSEVAADATDAVARVFSSSIVFDSCAVKPLPVLLSHINV